MANRILYGFHTLESIFDQRVTNATVPLLGNAVQEALDAHRRMYDIMFGMFAVRHTLAQRRFQKAGTAHRLQPLDEFGRARKTKTVPGEYTVGYPLQDAGDAFGRTYKALLKMTVREVNDQLASLFDADIQWCRSQIMARLLNPAWYPYPDPIFSDVTVKGLANAANNVEDTDTYAIMEGDLSAEADTHYVAQANAIDDSNDPFDDDRENLMEHSENGGEVIALIPPGLTTSVQALEAFYVKPRPEIQRSITTDQLIADFPVEVPGRELGFHEAGVWISEWKQLPANYIVYIVTEGEPAIGMREDEVEELQGFGPTDSIEEFPFYTQYYGRTAGFGAWNRIGALVRRVGNGTYAAPAPYTRLPMP